jgi:glycosyltransferase involved in cell wall biosynthesis
MKKILVVGDSPTVKTGFSRVCEQICLGLYNAGHQVILLGVNDPADRHDYPFYIYPAFSIQGQDVLGLQKLPQVIAKEKPDVVLLFNDCWVCEQYYMQIQKQYEVGNFKLFAYFPVDSHGYMPFLVKWLHEIDGVATYTQFGVDVLKAAKFKGEAQVFPHGVDTKTFYPVGKLEARHQLGLSNLKQDFVVLNANRNQPRKRIDLTIKGFAKFAQGKDDVWLYLHMGTKDVGWDVIPLFEREMRAYGNVVDRLVLTDKSPRPGSVPEAMLNLIYNSADVYVNTSLGEGWSLTNMEASICGVPQVVPNHSACAELWGEGRGVLLDVVDWQTDKDCLIERGAISVDHLAKTLDKLYKNQTLRQQLGTKTRSYFNQSKFDWAQITKDMEAWLTK